MSIWYQNTRFSEGDAREFAIKDSQATPLQPRKMGGSKNFSMGRLQSPTSGTPVKHAQDHGDVAKTGVAWRYWGTTAVVLTAVWAVGSAGAGELTFYWPVFPLAIWGVVLLSSTLWVENNRTGSLAGAISAHRARWRAVLRGTHRTEECLEPSRVE